jgi:hypothetical protein
MASKAQLTEWAKQDDRQMLHVVLHARSANRLSFVFRLMLQDDVHAGALVLLKL